MAESAAGGEPSDDPDDDRLPWWVDSQVALARLPVGAPESITPMPDGSGWAWAVGTSAGTVVFHGDDGRRPQVVGGWSGRVHDVAVDPQGRRLAAVDSTGQVLVIDLTEAEWRAAVQCGTARLTRWSVSFSPDGSRLAVVAGGGLVVVDVARAADLDRVPDAASAAWLDDDVLAVADDQGRLRRLSIDSPLAPEVIEADVTALGRRPDGLVVADRSGLITVRRPSALDEVLTAFDAGIERIVEIDAHPDGDIHVLTDEGEGWVVGDASGAAARRTITGCLQAAWSISGGELGLALADGAAAVETLDAPKRRLLRGHTFGVRSVAAVGTAGRVVIGGTGPRPLLRCRLGIDAAPVPVGAARWTTSAVASRRDGELLFGRELDGSVWVHSETSTYRTEPSAGGALSVSASGRWVAAHGGPVAVVDIHRVDRSARTEHVPGQRAVFNPDGPGLAVVGGDLGTTIQLYRPGSSIPEPLQELDHEPTALTWGPPSVGITYAARGEIASILPDGPGWETPEDEVVVRLEWNPAGTQVAMVGQGRATVRTIGFPDALTIPALQAVYDVSWIGDATLVVATRGGVLQVFELHDVTGASFTGAFIAWGRGVTAVTAEPVSPVPPADDPADDLRRGSIVPDRPTAAGDLLGARAMAVRLDALMRRELASIGADSEDRSLAINIDAAWGRGKSTLVTNLVDLSKADRGDAPDWVVVHHDAWRHSRTSPSWWALARDLRHAVSGSRNPVGRLRLVCAELVHRVRRAIGIVPLLAVATGVGLAVVGLTRTDWFEAGNGTSAVEALLAVATAVVAGATLVGGLAMTFKRFVGWTHTGGSDALSHAGMTPLGQAAEHVWWLRRQASRGRWGGRRRPERPLLFIVDELDRCQAATVVEILDSVHTLMRPDVHARGVRDGLRRAPPTRPLQALARWWHGRALTPAPLAVVVLADSTWIRRSYQLEHESQETGTGLGPSLGAQFHAKIFNLVMSLPPLNPRQHMRYAMATLARLTDQGPTEVPASTTVLRGSRFVVTADEQVQEIDERGRIVPPALRSPVERSPTPPPQSLPSPVLDDASAIAEQARAEVSEEKMVERQAHVLQRFAGKLPRNPRALKRVVNDWTMQDLIRSGLPEDERVGKDELIGWVILTQSWPDLADALLALPDLHAPTEIRSPAIRAHLGPTEDGSPDLLALLQSKPVRDIWPLLPPGESDTTPDEKLMIALATLAGQWPPVLGRA